MESRTFLFILQILLVIVLLMLLLYIVRLIRLVRYTKRLSNFALDSKVLDEDSLLDKLEESYYSFRRKIAKSLSKSKFLLKYSEKYEKYIDKEKREEEAMDYIATKFIMAILVFLVIVIFDVFWLNTITLFQFSYSFLIGFFIPDVLLISQNKLRKKSLENDLLKAITIMNNAFKSGNSIMQAINLVSIEVEGPIRDEFKKMYDDLNYGLSIEVVFKRFSKRVDLEEARYMTTSLTILNKTGGDIAKVFSSIEKSFFARRKLKTEMASLTGSATFLFRILCFIPFAICLLLIIINPSYFAPMLSNPLGLLILGIVLIIYVSYIIVIKKVMKVGDM